MMTMTQMLGQMMWMPASLLARWMDLLVATMWAQPCCQGREAMDWSGMAPGTGFPERGISGDNPSARGDGATKETKEEKKMSNCCCDNDNGMIKLVQFSIVSIKRCEERLLYQGEIIERDDMSDEAFATWVVALYLQDDLPPEGNRGPKPGPGDKKFIRVYHHVLESWPRQKDNCCEDREVTVLRGIEEAIRSLTRHVGGGRSEEAPASS
jgi:hypothetical protein